MAETASNLWTPAYMGGRIAALRRRRGMKQRELAAAVRAFGIPLHDSVLARFEKWGSNDPNARRPQFVHLWIIAHVLSTPDELVTVRDLGGTEKEYPELRLIRQGLATPSIVTGKGSDGSAERRLLLMLRGGRRPDAQVEQPTLDSSLIRSVTSSVTRARRRRG